MSTNIGLVKQLGAPNIHSMLSENAKILRSCLLDKLIEHNQPIYLSEIAIKERLDLTTILKELTDKGLAASKEDGAIIGAYPVSALTTRHRVQLVDGRFFYSMCAIDALGSVYEFNQDLSVASSCKFCDKIITIELEKKKVKTVNPSTTYALHVDIEKYKDWAANC